MTATHNTLQHTAPMQNAATHCNTLPVTSFNSPRHCETQPTANCCNTLHENTCGMLDWRVVRVGACAAATRTAVWCSALQRVAGVVGAGACAGDGRTVVVIVGLVMVGLVMVGLSR